MPLGAARDGVEQFFGRERFGEIINRAGFDGFDGKFGRGVGRKHEHRQFGPLIANLGEEVVAAHAPEARVSNDHEKFPARKQNQPFLGGFDSSRDVAFVLEHRLQRQAHVFFVIHDEHGG